MNTHELITKIEALKEYAAEMEAKHGTALALVRPKWLESLPVAQFVELCDTYTHDEVSSSQWPSTWLRFGAMQMNMTCERLDLPKPQPVDHIDTLRALATANNKAQ
jgi:hypothetical protein